MPSELGRGWGESSVEVAVDGFSHLHTRNITSHLAAATAAPRQPLCITLARITAVDPLRCPIFVASN